MIAWLGVGVVLLVAILLAARARRKLRRRRTRHALDFVTLVSAKRTRRD